MVYQTSSSGTTVPSGSWSSTVPSVSQGEYLWTRTTVTFNTGSPVVSYSVAYQGEDGPQGPAVPLSDATPQTDGTASPGTGTSAARDDHVHGTDTSRAAAVELSTLENGLAIIVDGNKTSYASGAAIGDFVLVENSTISGITDGMYKAAKAIPYNTAIDSSYLSSLNTGALNSINSQIANLGLLKVDRISKSISANGNTDSNADLSSETSAFSNVVAIQLEGYTPSASWDTKLFVKQIYPDTRLMSFRTQGSANQSYICVFSVFHY